MLVFGGESNIVISNCKRKLVTHYEIENPRFYLDFSVQRQKWMNEKRIFLLNKNKASLKGTL